MMPWFLRHYSQFADRIVIFDEKSDDGTREIARACQKVTIEEWPHRGLDDEKFTAAVNSVAITAAGKADWIMFPDIDELLYSRNMTHLLSGAQEAAIASTGYALISPTGWPKDDGASQLYDLVKTGVPQPNYDKVICWRPHIPMRHTIGRHTQGGFPQCGGRIGPKRLKLFHCHHIGGVADTVTRNARNYGRAVNKRFAWNYAPGFNSPKQNGTASWVAEAINRGLLRDVVNA